MKRFKLSRYQLSYYNQKYRFNFVIILVFTPSKDPDF